ncbi:MAG: ABC transporter ATP-binding protein [Deltaproteobacteria bacterium]|nr:ABC transporter ATP-binding protein [Deltaproteobacteria bacterium]
MPDTVIQVENLSKLYRIGAREAGYRTFRETLVDAVKAPLQRLGGLFSPPSVLHLRTSDLLWALKDVSFDVKQGEVVGIIGRNGAGKSTLLKILSKITEPTKGRVQLRGRVGSLLEVGTGFHPELTGHENIYLYGAILGMNRWEITRKFDEIVAFAELEKFIDTPVKRYSSGMYMRLAFAVAAHLEPEILLVDEVLAVGDAAFQKKCLGKMGDVSKEGRTILFVSHHMGSISLLCTTGVLLQDGSLNLRGPIDEVVSHYMSTGVKLQGKASLLQDRQISNDDFAFRDVLIRTAEGNDQATVDLLKGFDLAIQYEILKPLSQVIVGFRLWTLGEQCVFTSTDVDQQPDLLTVRRHPGKYLAICHIPGDYLRPGQYYLDVAASIPNMRVLEDLKRIITFEVVDTGSLDAKLSVGRQGVIAPTLEWISTKEE